MRFSRLRTAAPVALLVFLASPSPAQLLGQAQISPAAQATSPAPSPLPAELPLDPADRVVLVVSVDGLRPDAWEAAATPTLDLLAASGAATRRALSAELPKTLPGHTSMLTGVQPSVHGVTHNRWRPWEPTLKQPTVFRWVRAAGLDTTLIATKRKFRLLDVAGDVGRFEWVRDRAWRVFVRPELKGSSRQVVDECLDLLEEGRRGLYFLPLPEVDDRGHKKGWMSEEQLEAVAAVDRELGRLRQGLDELGLREETSWLLTADHGGHGKNHGDDVPEDRLVPFVLSGRGVPGGVDLGQGVEILDVAPTAAALLGVAPPVGLGGRAVAAGLLDPPPAPDPEVNDIPPPGRSLASRVRDMVSSWNPF
jgi:hypothetical protein